MYGYVLVNIVYYCNVYVMCILRCVRIGLACGASGIVVYISMAGNRRSLKNGLTPKQNKFTSIVLEQIKEKGEMNLTEAAMQSYNVSNKNVAGVIGNENINNPKIKQTLEEALSSAGLSIEEAIGNLNSIAKAENVKITGDQKLKANIEILKLHGVYPMHGKGLQNKTKKTVTRTLSYDEAKAQLTMSQTEVSSFVSEAEID